MFELLDGEVHIGDVVSGDLEELGGQTFVNETQGLELGVFVQGVHCTIESAKQLLSGY